MSCVVLCEGVWRAVYGSWRGGPWAIRRRVGLLTSGVLGLPLSTVGRHNDPLVGAVKSSVGPWPGEAWARPWVTDRLPRQG